MPDRKDTINHVGPLHFTGPAAERVARIREDNDYEAVNVQEWRANIASQHEEMSKADVEFFSTLRKKMG